MSISYIDANSYSDDKADLPQRLPKDIRISGFRNPLSTSRPPSIGNPGPNGSNLLQPLGPFGCPGSRSTFLFSCKWLLKKLNIEVSELLCELGSSRSSFFKHFLCSFHNLPVPLNKYVSVTLDTLRSSLKMKVVDEDEK